MFRYLAIAVLLTASLFAVNSQIRGASNIVVTISSKFDQGKDQGPFNFEPFYGNYYNPEFAGIKLSDLKRKLGSGVIVGKDGYILTNYHIIENKEAVTVSLIGNSDEFSAKVVGIDFISDLAVLKIEKENLPSFFYKGTLEIDSGDEVYVLGNPYGKELFITKATVSYIVRDDSLEKKLKYIQLQGNIHPLTSGGAVVNQNGKFLGVVNAEFSKNAGLKGYFVATPASTVKASVAKILEQEQKEPVWFGIGIDSLTEDLKQYYKRDKGVVINSVDSGSPAQKAGLQKGDLIISIGDVSVENMSDINYLIATMRPGDMKVVEYQRDMAIEETVITLVKPFGTVDDSIGGVLINGLIVEPLTRKLRREFSLDSDLKGVVVNSTNPGSSAKESGFEKGDIIIRVGEKEVADIETLKLMLAPTTQDFTVYRKGIIKTITWEKNE